MELFSDFCNICYKTDDIKDISEEKNLKDALIIFVGHTEIIEHNVIYLCQLCCKELARFRKFRKMCFSNLINLREIYFNMKSKLELVEDAATVKNTLVKFVHEKVMPGNSLAETNSSVSISTECQDIATSSAYLNNENYPVFYRQEIYLKAERNEYDSDDTGNVVSVENTVTECDESRVASTNEESMTNNMLTCPEDTNLERFQRESYEDFDVSDVNNVPVVNNNEGNVNSGIKSTEEEQENNASEDLKPDRNKNESSDALHTAFEFVNICTIVNVQNIKSEENEEANRCSNDKSTAAIMNTQSSRRNEREYEYDSGRCPRTLQSGARKRLYLESEAHTCALCNKSFSARSYLLRHERRHSGARPYKCSVCNKAFTAAQSLNVHERTHSGIKPYQCTVCNKSFTQSSSLTKHGRIHSGDRPYKCSVCSKEFKQLTNLNQHKRTHSGERLYRCSDCNKALSSSSALTKHKRIHSGNKPYKCIFCNKSFTQSNDLIVHARIHSGAKPYECAVCRKEFRQASNLTAHERTHSGDRPYKCTICNTAFITSSALTVHKRIHSGVRPYKCTVCNKSFADLSSLTKHKRTHSSDRTYDCTAFKTQINYEEIDTA